MSESKRQVWGVRRTTIQIKTQDKNRESRMNPRYIQDQREVERSKRIRGGFQLVVHIMYNKAYILF